MGRSRCGLRIITAPPNGLFEAFVGLTIDSVRYDRSEDACGLASSFWTQKLCTRSAETKPRIARATGGS
jgi:hypothetical protein